MKLKKETQIPRIFFWLYMAEFLVFLVSPVLLVIVLFSMIMAFGGGGALLYTLSFTAIAIICIVKMVYIASLSRNGETRIRMKTDMNLTIVMLIAGVVGTFTNIYERIDGSAIVYSIGAIAVSVAWLFVRGRIVEEYPVESKL